MSVLVGDTTADAAPDGEGAARRGSAYLGIAITIGVVAWLLAGMAAFNLAH